MVRPGKYLLFAPPHFYISNTSHGRHRTYIISYQLFCGCPFSVIANTLGSRMIGNPWLWHPVHEEQLLQQDWEEILELIALGGVESISARHGQVFTIAP